MLVAEQLFLLLRRDDGRAEIGSGFEGYGLVGAVLSDLVAAGHLALGDEEKDPTVRVTTTVPVGHPVLDTALERIRSKEGKRLSSVVLDDKLRPMDTIPASLVSAGVITIEPKRFGGLIPARYPVRDPAPERALRERLRAVLAGATAQPNEATLLALLKGYGRRWPHPQRRKGRLEPYRCRPPRRRGVLQCPGGHPRRRDHRAAAGCSDDRWWLLTTSSASSSTLPPPGSRHPGLREDHSAAAPGRRLLAHARRARHPHPPRRLDAAVVVTARLPPVQRCCI